MRVGRWESFSHTLSQTNKEYEWCALLLLLMFLRGWRFGRESGEFCLNEDKACGSLKLHCPCGIKDGILNPSDSHLYVFVLEEDGKVTVDTKGGQRKNIRELKTNILVAMKSLSIKCQLIHIACFHTM